MIRVWRSRVKNFLNNAGTTNLFAATPFRSLPKFPWPSNAAIDVLSADNRFSLRARIKSPSLYLDARILDDARAFDELLPEEGAEFLRARPYCIEALLT